MSIHYKKEFASLLRANAHAHHPHHVFRDFCELAALSLSNAADLSQRDVREARYMQVIGTYSKEQAHRFAEMLGCVVGGLEEGYCDFLGETFMDMEIGNAVKGQYFTPYPVARMMASLTCPQSPMENGKDHFTVQEPAVGSGVMVIALAEVLKEMGVNYQQCMHVTAVDCDATAAHMAYIQLTLLHVPAMVIHGNSLSMECYSRWYTLAHTMGGWSFRLRRERATSQALQLSVIESSVLNTQPEHSKAIDLGQMSLF